MAAAPAPTTTRPRLSGLLREDRWTRFRFGLLLSFLALALSLPLLGARESSYGELSAALASGRTMIVQVDWPLDQVPTITGAGPVTLAWNDGGLNRVTTVCLNPGQGVSCPPTQTVVTGDLAEHLEALAPAGHVGITGDLQVAGGRIPGWQVPTPWLLAGLSLTFLLLLYLAHGPQPWWATRWAWFWLIFSPVMLVALPAFLFLCGPPPGVTRSSHPGRRLTGGWAWLLMVVLGTPAAALLGLTGG